MKKIIFLLMVVASFLVAPIIAQTTAATTTIKGKGTPNYLPLFKTATTLTNSVIYQSLNNIGINTLSPSAKLHVNGNFILEDGFMSFSSGKGFTSGFDIQAPQPINYKVYYPNNVASPSASQQASHIRLYDDGINYFGIGLTTGTTIGGQINQSSTNICANQTGYGNVVLWTNSLPRLIVKPSGVVNIQSCPTSSVGLISGDIYSDSGTLKIIP